jgi:hypothetical protein
MFLEWGWETNRLKAGNVTVQNNGTITHGWNTASTTNAAGEWEPNGGVFIECSNMIVEAGGSIYADSLGYFGSYGGHGYGPGRGSNDGSSYAGGGGYGGKGGRILVGGIGGSDYGTATNPASPGSGGAGGVSYATPGGGYIKIIASGTVTVNGAISAQGTNVIGGSGGSGGGIYLQGGTLNGGGTIRADGGSGTTGGGGGGGRIAIYAANATGFGGQLSAKNGAASDCNFPDFNRDSTLPGTVYLSDWAILSGSLTNGGAARFTAGTGVAASVTISNYSMFLEWGWETNRLKAGNVIVQNGGKIRHSYNTVSTTNAGGEWVPNAGVFIECTNLTVLAGGEINADTLGYAANYNDRGFGPGSGTFHSASSTGGGGGYGGAGGCGSNALAYGGVANGTAADPNNTGSGGGGGNGRGALGGGYVKIVAVETVNVAGVISVSGAGARSSSKAGGGSGGGVYIRCRSLTGGGAIQANGGAGAPAGGGGGGGGRIAVFASQAPFYTIGLQYNVAPGAGGTNAMPGSPGTIHLDFKPRGTMFSAW